jgi:DNA-binding PadR family transcriptional regulator
MTDLPQLQEAVLQVIGANGGTYAGTLRLTEEIPADPRELIRNLRRCQHDHLITSRQSHGGRGHKSVHRLTQKGREHVQSK